ncbi:bifunctional tetrahydrofolate synthase/dihydrofolate synthase [Pasteurella bettyae]|uniref:Dihydrofolate synthase/folylpolyglutamate synthase n=1 Tax=Pasteurella bettyae CCUG 2042 TaxID=1095749 RepID=I3DI77_9PAST|nr:bifunctional tetrahydrofolate synthase/dihydrofolate synthase [Pasteurella bettyae]EIJ71420.1 bifunctional protein FolC [Pasteurella bettyae CCUG 2042]SUB21669.1 folylpolyglutamate synthase [Pasteurella bettyae]
MQNNHNLQATSSLDEWLSYLENSHFKSIDLGLERITAVAKELDILNPAPFVITVGGTNGKGTTCRLLETILINSGLRVGVYSSPHLLRYNERVRIQNQDLPDDSHTQSFAYIEQHKKESLTYFEFSTLSALYLFKQANLDVVILEVGLGGRLDATNIVDSDIAVITSIDIDHVDFLGSTREQIGFEKAGIFRTNKPVIIGEPDIPYSILAHAEKLHCQLSCRDRDWFYSAEHNRWHWHNQNRNFENLPICSIPIQNAATALAVVQYLPFVISEEIIRKSLQEVELTGRFQTIKVEHLQPIASLINRPIEELPRIIIDVGHNPHAARYLASKLIEIKSKNSQKITAVCGVLKDKDADGVLLPLLSIIDRWHCVTLEGPRGQSGQDLFAKLQQLADKNQLAIDGKGNSSIESGIKEAISETNKNDIVLIFGSFVTVTGFLELL